MDIVNALRAIRGGSFVRWERKGQVYFGVESHLEPFGKTEICKIDLDDATFLVERPIDLSKIDFEEDPKLCLESIESDSYTEISYDEVLQEIQKKWDDNQKEKDEESE